MLQRAQPNSFMRLHDEKSGTTSTFRYKIKALWRAVNRDTDMGVKTTRYPELPDLVIADAAGDARTLNQEVWKHEKEARKRSMPLVLEVHARSVLASRRLTEWWESGDQLMQDTLSGVYLLRIDLQKFGPEAVLRLTPYAVAGAPLFVGWNEVGQVCSRTQFHELTREAFSLPLSAFVEDVLSGRQHTLNPAPSLGNAERTREALALKRASTALLTSRRPARLGESDPTPEQPRFVDTPVSDEREEQHEQPAQSTSSTASSTAPVGNDNKPALEQSDLDVLLARARARFGVLEDRVGARLKLTLDDLRTIDGFLTQLQEEERDVFARELGAVLAVYVGDTIRERVTADWVLSGSKVVSSALELQGDVLGERKSVQPLEWVVEILSDVDRSLYGQALSWCRIF